MKSTTLDLSKVLAPASLWITIQHECDIASETGLLCQEMNSISLKEGEIFDMKVKVGWTRGSF